MSSLRGLPRSMGIVGGGFGMYGWMPAALRAGVPTVVTLERYRSQILERSELRRYVDSLHFVDNDRQLPHLCDGLVCARRPTDQPPFVSMALSEGFRGHFFLEKPLATTPKKAIEVIDQIEAARARLTIGFTLDSLPWVTDLHERLSGGERDARLDWRFRAHHFAKGRDVWKRDPQQGGGVLRFYAIHLLPIIAGVPRHRVLRVSRDAESRKIQMRFAAGLGEIEITCDSDWKGPAGFSVSVGEESLHHSRDPFDFDRNSSLMGDSENVRSTPSRSILPDEDRRIEPLTSIILRAADSLHAIEVTARPHVRLWQSVEACPESSGDDSQD